MKTARQSVILEIIASREIDTQNQLMEELLKRGLKSTQATLSRDIKELRLVKELSSNGSYRYVVSRQDKAASHDERLRKIFRESVVSCETAQNIIVIKTLPGLAMAASSALDGMGIDDLVGSVAGDDTAFLAMRDLRSAAALCEEIKELF
ncbi:MAG: arginine repressor [Oscillospiraceae bacterium]